MAEEPQVKITVTYRGENGDGWVPTSQRDLWNYAVRTGQVVVPTLEAGPPCAEGHSIDTGDTITLEWIPPEYEGRLVPADPPPQPTYFTLDNDEPYDEPWEQDTIGGAKDDT